MGRFRGFAKLTLRVLGACAFFAAFSPSLSVADNSIPAFLMAPQQFSCNGTPVSRDANQTCSQPSRNEVQPVVCRGGVLYDQANAEWGKLRKKLSANAPKTVMPYKLVIPKRIISPMNGHQYADGVEQAWVYVADDGPMKGQIVFYERADNYPPENPQYASADIFVDPSLNDSGKVQDSVSGDTLSDRFSSFDGRLSGLISGANAQNCDFVRDSQKIAANNRMDPVEKLVNAFTDPNTCKQMKFPCCGGGDGLEFDCAEWNGAPVTQASRQNLMDVNEVMKMTGKDFNLELIYQLRKGLLNTQLELAKSMDPDDPAFKHLQFGPSTSQAKSAAMQCEFPGTGKNNRTQKVLQLAAQYQKKTSDPRADEMRRQEEVNQNFQSIQDVMSAEVAKCAAKTQLGVDGKLTPQYRKIMDRNRMLGLIAYRTGFWANAGQSLLDKNDGVDDIYSAIRQELVSRGWLSKSDLNSLENPYACRQEGNYVIGQIRKKLLSRTDSYDVVMKSPITAKLRAARADAFREVQKRFDDLTEQCADADQPYSAGFLYDSGNVLWKNKPLVQAIARKYASENRGVELDRLHSIYCDNLDKKKTMDHVRDGAFVAATAAAIVAPPLFSVEGGLTATGAVVVSAVGASGTGLSIATATGAKRNAQADLQNAVSAYMAKFADSRNLSETASAYHSAVGNAILSDALAPLDAISLTKVVLQFPTKRTQELAELALTRMLKSGRGGSTVLAQVEHLAQSCKVAPETCESSVAKLSAAAAPVSYRALSIRGSVIQAPEQITNTVNNLAAANKEIREAYYSAANPEAFVRELKSTLPSGGYYRALDENEVANALKNGYLDDTKDFAPLGTARVAHGDNFIFVRCAECTAEDFKPGEAGSSVLNKRRIKLDKLEFIAFRPRSIEAAQAVGSEQLALRREVKSAYAGIDAITPKSESVKNVRFPKQGVPNFTIIYRADPASYEKALQSGKIVEGSVAKLAPGKYTYVVNEDGTQIFGHVEDGWETGTKHIQLANGRKVMAAGEVAIGEDGSITMNLQSGSLMRLADNQERRLVATQSLFERESGKKVRITEGSMIPNEPPTIQRYLEYCSDKAFKLSHESLCDPERVALVQQGRPEAAGSDLAGLTESQKEVVARGEALSEVKTIPKRDIKRIKAAVDTCIKDPERCQEAASEIESLQSVKPKDLRVKVVSRSNGMVTVSVQRGSTSITSTMSEATFERMATAPRTARERWDVASKIVGDPPLTDTEKKIIERMHAVGKGPIYTPEEIVEKANIGRAAPRFRRNGVLRKFMESWVTGDPGKIVGADSLSPAMKEYKSARREAESVMAYDIIRTRKATITVDGVTIEAPQGFLQPDRDTIIVNGRKISIGGENHVLIKQEGKVADYPKKPIEAGAAPAATARSVATSAPVSTNTLNEPTHFSDPRQLESFMEANPSRSVTIKFSNGVEKGASLIPAKNGNPAYLEYEGMNSAGGRTTLNLKERDWNEFKMYFQKSSTISQPNGTEWISDALAEKLRASNAMVTITRSDGTITSGTIREIRADGSIVLMKGNSGVIVQPSQIKQIDTKEMVQVYGPTSD